ncbi:MAG: NAD(P)-dependent oxidoreductase [Bauldia sp.]
MGYPMVERLVKRGHAVEVWNRTRAKAEPLEAQGARVVDRPSDLADVDILFTMVSTGADLDEVVFGGDGVLNGSGPAPRIMVDCTSIGADESAVIRAKLTARSVALLASPVSGNGKTVKAGKLSTVVSGPRDAFDIVRPYLETVAGNGVAYVGEGDLARFCKIAHNVLLGVVIQNLSEITVLAEKAGVPRHAFLEFINNSVLGSIFSRYKTPALVNLDFTTTFTPALLRKDLDLGLAAARELGVAMPVTAATREALQAHFGAASLQPDPGAYLEQDFSALIETVALAAGMKLTSENKPVKSGLEIIE